MASSARIDELRKKFEENPRRYFAPLANEYRKAGDVEQAISICREYLPQQPGHMSGHIVYGQALYEARQFDEAKTVFETALALDPENLIALRHLGDIALIVGDSTAARNWYRRVLEADPRNEEIQAQLASLEKTVPEPPSTPTPAIPSLAIPEPEPAKPLLDSASTAETVVIPAVHIPEPAPAPSAPPVAATMPEIEHLPIPDLPVAEAASPPVPTLELESPVAGASAQPTSAEPPPIDSFSLAGLETTSFAADGPTSAPPAPSDAAGSEPPPIPSLSTAPTLELDTKKYTPSSAPVVPHDTAPAPASVPAVPEMIDLGPPLEAAQEPVAKPEPPPTAAEATPVAATPSIEPAQAAIPPTAEPAIDKPSAVAAAADAPTPSQELPFVDLGEPTPAEPAIPAPDSGPFVTETMAELYLAQGHRDEALRVYRALLEQRPGDAGLQEKIAALRAQPPKRATPARSAPAQPAGPTIREVLTIVAMRRPGSRSPAAAGNGGGQQDVAAVPTTAPQAGAPAAAAQQPPAGDGLGALFGYAPASAADESAARSLALAFASGNGAGAGRDEGLAGAPAHVANNELSLDSVFGGDAAAPAAPATFSFDQFFSRRAATEEMPVPRPSGEASSASPDEVAHFTKWLEGLKQR